MTQSVIVAVLSFLGTLAGVFFTNRRSTALITYRLEQLEQKVMKHNSLIERTYELEKRAGVVDEQIKVANHRIDDLERSSYDR